MTSTILGMIIGLSIVGYFGNGIHVTHQYIDKCMEYGHDYDHCYEQAEIAWDQVSHNIPAMYEIVKDI